MPDDNPELATYNLRLSPENQHVQGPQDNPLANLPPSAYDSQQYRLAHLPSSHTAFFEQNHGSYGMLGFPNQPSVGRQFLQQNMYGTCMHPGAMNQPTQTQNQPTNHGMALPLTDHRMWAAPQDSIQNTPQPTPIGLAAPSQSQPAVGVAQTVASGPVKKGGGGDGGRGSGGGRGAKAGTAKGTGAGTGGRRVGVQNFSVPDLNALINYVEQHRPISQAGWDMVTSDYNLLYATPHARQSRLWDALKNKFQGVCQSLADMFGSLIDVHFSQMARIPKCRSSGETAPPNKQM
jgi:hypothetical protein